MIKAKVLVVEDDQNIRTQMKWALVQDYEVFLATDGKKAMDVMKRERPGIVTLDLGLPPAPENTTEGFKLLGQILEFEPSTKVMVVTGSPERSAAIQAISQGAHDFFTKPIDIDELKAILKRANYVFTLESEYKALQKQVHESAFGEIIGSSPEIQEVFKTVRKVATTDVSILITGESGTGKELVARAIHNQGARKDKPFIPINCGAIPENLMESELFGHEKGSFTGAHALRKGKFEVAAGGTLFLDEIGELPMALQVKLLRFLQDHKIERVGGREQIEVDIRVIAATNRDIKKMAAQELFREDLYYRLAVLIIDMPPLRERGEDIMLLAKAFLHKYSTNQNKPKHLSQDAVDAINGYDWPGNVRELENRLHRATTLSEGANITPADIGLGPEQFTEQILDLKRARENVDRKYINMAIMKFKGNISKAADELGLSRPTLHNLIKKHKISLK